MTDIDRFANELGWECGEDYPEWGHTDVYLKTISRGYCLPHETPRDAYWRVCTTVANRLKKPEIGKGIHGIYLEWLVVLSVTCSF